MSHVTILTGPDRRRRWSEEDQCRIVAAAFAPGATVAAVVCQYDVATSLIYKWRRTVRARGWFGSRGGARVGRASDRSGIH
ncbi:transposase [Mesorhizobium sp.]|uniref:transposase n=1 Tax=Mesorhizobium sp. TaxID=1871066 RepID=UPI00338FEFDB